MAYKTYMFIIEFINVISKVIIRKVILSKVIMSKVIYILV